MTAQVLQLRASPDLAAALRDYRQVESFIASALQSAEQALLTGHLEIARQQFDAAEKLLRDRQIPALRSAWLAAHDMEFPA